MVEVFVINVVAPSGYNATLHTLSRHTALPISLPPSPPSLFYYPASDNLHPSALLPSKRSRPYLATVRSRHTGEASWRLFTLRLVAGALRHLVLAIADDLSVDDRARNQLRAPEDAAALLGSRYEIPHRGLGDAEDMTDLDRKSTRLNSSH